MKFKNAAKYNYWMHMLWTGCVYSTRMRLKAKGATRAALRRFQIAASK